MSATPEKHTSIQGAGDSLRHAPRYYSDPQTLHEAKRLLEGHYQSAHRMMFKVIMTVLACDIAAELISTALTLPRPFDTMADSLVIAALVIPLFYFQIAKPYLSQLRNALNLGKALVEANNHLAQAAITDELTGLHNRRGFFEVARHQFLVSKRYDRPLSMLFCDLDNLKRINDSIGHEAGDDAIRDAARAISRSVREADLPARVGGDEFAVLLPQSDETAARATAERIQSALARLNSGRNPQLSLSIGLREADMSAMRSVDDLLALADADMYRAKTGKKARNGNASAH